MPSRSSGSSACICLGYLPLPRFLVGSKRYPKRVNSSFSASLSASGVKLAAFSNFDLVSFGLPSRRDASVYSEVLLGSPGVGIPDLALSF